ncbi:hypothetical protein WS65_31795 [Burkholderia anthina]|nr:hypothetical protein WS65_31795 [Burkholderia anthina]
MAHIPWRAIYTTNYDDILERAYSEEKSRLTSVTCDLDSREYTTKKNIVVHINGFIKTLTSDAIDHSFKLTNTSYLTEDFSKSNWSFLFRRTLETCRACIFIGYSMYDLDIQRIIFSSENSREKTIFIERTGKAQKDIDNSLQIDFGEVFPIGLNGFLNEVDKIKKEYSPQETDGLLSAFEEQIISDTTEHFRDDDLFDLLLKGDPKIDFIWDKVNNSTSRPYYVTRDNHNVASSELQKNADNVLVFSDMANGKTLSLMGLGCRLQAIGYSVYWLRDDAEDTIREIEYLCSLDRPIVLIIENYNNRLEEIRLIQLKRMPHLKLLLSAKRASHEVFREDLMEIIEPDRTFEFQLDHLTDAEVTELNEILTTYKLWGERDAWGVEKKKRFLTHDCDRQFSSALLEIIKSPAIQQRFKALFDAFHSKTPTADVMVAASVLSLLGFRRPSESVISELLNNNYLYSAEFRRNPIIADLMKIGNGNIIPRSSILAKHGLTTFSDGRTLVEKLIKIAENAHALGENSQLYFGIYKDLVTFSILQQMLPEKGKRDALIRFYEAIKNLRAAQSHPHFWLQYAIARLASDRPDDLEKAKLYLDSAYAHAKKRPNYHTRHMDNVKARYLINHSVLLSEINAAMLELLDGHKLLLAQCRTEKTYAPFNVARHYLKFYNAKKKYLNQSHKKILTDISSQILEYARNLPDHVRTERAVQHCTKDLESLIADIDASAS